MKKNIVLLFVSLFVFGISSSIMAQDPNDLELHLNFDGDLSDASANAYVVTNTDATFTADRNDVAENALAFNGSSALLDVSFFDRPTVFSMSSWVKITDGADGMILSWCGTLGQTFEIAIWGGQLDLGEYDGTDWTEANFDATIPNNEWHHVGLTVNDNVASFFLDGVEQSFTMSADPGNGWGYSSSYDKLSIGGYYWGTDASRFFTGDLDDLRIYNAALTETEFTNIFNETVGIYSNENFESNMSIFINSANELKVISELSSNNSLQVAIYDMAGKEILLDKVNTNAYTTDLSSLKQGIYIAKVFNGVNSATQKFSITQ